MIIDKISVQNLSFIMIISPTSWLNPRPIKMDQISLRFFISLFLLLLTFNLNAQDSTRSSKLGRFSVETGVFFPSNSNFETTFNTKSTNNWRFGLDFGNKNWKLYPWLKFSTFKFSDSILITTTTSINDSIQITEEEKNYSIKLHQISIGLACPIKLNQNNELILRCAISENRHTINGVYLRQSRLGFFMSAGYKHTLNKDIDVTLDLSHSYNKNKLDTHLRDWSGFSLQMGLAINIL